jgi:type 1 glutamine amidotransferase
MKTTMHLLFAALTVTWLTAPTLSLPAAEAVPKGKRLLYFTKCSGFEHSVVKRPAQETLSHSEKILTELGQKYGFEVTCTKDGGVFTPQNIASYDVFVFYTSGNLFEPGTDKTPPMTPAGKAALLEAIRKGKGFVGIHAANDSFHVQPDPPDKSSRFKAYGDKVDPYIAMLGGEFIRHGPQQVATQRVADNTFPGCDNLGSSFDSMDEWYTFKDFAKDLHVILVMETKGMKGVDYQRAPFPSTWARRHGQGRVFYTSMGHREDVWTNARFQEILLGGLAWTAGAAEAQLTPNLETVTPGYGEIQPEEDPGKKK